MSETAESIARKLVADWSAHWMHRIASHEDEALFEAIATAIKEAERAALEKAENTASKYAGETTSENGRRAAMTIAAAIRALKSGPTP